MHSSQAETRRTADAEIFALAEAMIRLQHWREYQAELKERRRFERQRKGEVFDIETDKAIA